MIASELHGEASAMLADTISRLRALALQGPDPRALDQLVSLLCRAAEVEGLRARDAAGREADRAREEERHAAAMAGFREPAPF